MENVYKSLDEVIHCIQNTKEYQKCLSLKEKMKDNEELVALVEKVKIEQKKYVQSGYDEEIKKKLDCLEDELNSIPLYLSYMENLSKINQMIEYVKDSLNDYFYQVLNEKNTSF